MKPLFLTFLASFILLSCTKESIDSTVEAVESTSHTDMSDKVLRCVDEFISELSKRDTKSCKYDRIYDKSSMYCITRDSHPTKSGSFPTDLYVVNFQDNQGYAVVSSSIGGELRLVCLTEKGGLGIARMQEAQRLIQSTDSVTGLTECASPDDSLFVPMLLLGGDDPLANAYRPIDDGPIGGGPSGIVGPFLMTKWSQKGQPFNDLLPNDYAVGCVPLAVAQIMAYEESASSMVFNGVTCSWSEMKTVHTYPDRDSLGTPAGQEQVANFLYAMGSADNCNVTYGPSTSATATDARRAFLNNGYSNATIHFGVSFHSFLRSTVRNQLFSGHPVYCDGSHSVSSGHAWVIDGYYINGYYHINWGWLGDSDGYYSEGVFDTTLRNSISSYDPGTNNELHNYVFGFNVITY